jgi:carboxylesterase
MCSLNASNRVLGGRVGILLMQAPGESAPELSIIADGLARVGATVRYLQSEVASADAVKSTRWRDWYVEAEHALTDMRKDCDIVIVGGSSVGAALGLLLAASHPNDVQGTALFAPTLWLNGRLTPWAAMMVCLALGRRAAEAIGISPWLSQGPSVPSEETLAEHRRLLEAARRALTGISQPTLIVHSREDRCAGLDNAGYLQRHLRGLVDMVILGGSHHSAGLNRQHDFIVEKATAFIASVARRPRQPAQGIKPAARLATILPKAA